MYIITVWRWSIKSISIYLYYSKAHIWLPIWLLWTPFLYLIPLSIYSTPKCSGFDLDLWPLKVIWSWIFLYHSKAHIWVPIWLLKTTSLHLVPFSRYSTSMFLGFDLDLWPQKVIWGEIFFIPFESPYMFPYLTSMNTISLSRTVLEIMPVRIWRPNKMADFDLSKVKVKNRVFFVIEKAPPLTKRRRLRYCASKSFRLYPCQRSWKIEKNTNPYLLRICTSVPENFPKTKFARLFRSMT